MHNYNMYTLYTKNKIWVNYIYYKNIIINTTRKYGYNILQENIPNNVMTNSLPLA